MNISGGNDSQQDFELNLAPIIDCFTVLITYLLVSASFLSLNALDVGVATQAEASLSGEPPLSLVIDLKTARSAAFILSGGASRLDQRWEIGPTSHGEWSLSDIEKSSSRIKKKWPGLEEISVKAEHGVQYKELVRIIESLKKSVAKIYLSE